MSAHGTGYGSGRVGSSVLPGLSLGIKVLEALLLEGCNPSLCCLPPGCAIGCKVFPANDRDLASTERLLEVVLVALDLASLSPCALGQFRAEELFWKTAVFHSENVACLISTGPV